MPFIKDFVPILNSPPPYLLKLWRGSSQGWVQKTVLGFWWEFFVSIATDPFVSPTPSPFQNYLDRYVPLTQTKHEIINAQISDCNHIGKLFKEAKYPPILPPFPSGKIPFPPQPLVPIFQYMNSLNCFLHFLLKLLCALWWGTKLKSINFFT